MTAILRWFPGVESANYVVFLCCFIISYFLFFAIFTSFLMNEWEGIICGCFVLFGILGAVHDVGMGHM